MPPICTLTWAFSIRRSPPAAWTVCATSAVSQKAWMETRGRGAICTGLCGCVGVIFELIVVVLLTDRSIDLALALVRIDDGSRQTLVELGQHGRGAVRARRRHVARTVEVERIGDLHRE